MRLKKISALSLAAAMSVCTVPAFGAAETENVNVPKYIFLFIGDGMSYPQVQTTNYYLNAIADDGDDVLTSESKLNMMKFPVAGSAQTSVLIQRLQQLPFLQVIRHIAEPSTWMKRWKLLMRLSLRN